MTPKQIIALVLGILGFIGIIVSFVIGFSPVVHALPALFGVILVGVAMVLLKA